MPETKAPALRALLSLDFAYVDRVWTLGTFADFKRNLVPFAKIIELYVLELVRVEKEIFVHSFATDETEALDVEPGNYSFLHSDFLT